MDEVLSVGELCFIVFVIVFATCEWAAEYCLSAHRHATRAWVGQNASGWFAFESYYSEYFFAHVLNLEGKLKVNILVVDSDPMGMWRCATRPALSRNSISSDMETYISCPYFHILTSGWCFFYLTKESHSTFNKVWINSRWQVWRTLVSTETPPPNSPFFLKKKQQISERLR